MLEKESLDAAFGWLDDVEAALADESLTPAARDAVRSELWEHAVSAAQQADEARNLSLWLIADVAVLTKRVYGLDGLRKLSGELRGRWSSESLRKYGRVGGTFPRAWRREHPAVVEEVAFTTFRAAALGTPVERPDLARTVVLKAIDSEGDDVWSSREMTEFLAAAGRTVAEGRLDEVNGWVTIDGVPMADTFGRYRGLRVKVAVSWAPEDDDA